MKGILAFDLGTSGVKCSLFDSYGRPLGAEYGEYKTYYTGTDWHEQKPMDWINQISLATHRLRKTFPDIEICSIGASGHSLGVIPVDAEGNLLVEKTPIWSDVRAKAQAERFFQKTDYRQWYERTGNGFPREIYSIFKIMWYQDNLPEMYTKTYKFIGSKDFVNLFLTGNAVTDVSYASGCGMYDLKNGCYCMEYAKTAGIDPQKMPEIYPSHQIIGYVTPKASQALGIPAGIPVVGGGVDNACMTLGAGCFEDGDTYASLGSSAWVAASTSIPLTDFETRIYTFAHCVPGQYVPGIGIFASGSALAWAADNFFSDYQGPHKFDDIGALAAKAPAGANGLMFNPCLAGGSAFDKSQNIRGCLFNLSLSHTRQDVARAVFEGIAMHLYMAAGTLVRSGQLGDSLFLVGGGSKGTVARQIYSDVFGCQMVVSSVRQDAASLGAAALAAVGCGLWGSFAPLREIHKKMTVSTPIPENTAVHRRLLPYYKKLCDACSDLGDLVIPLYDQI